MTKTIHYKRLLLSGKRGMGLYTLVDPIDYGVVNKWKWMRTHNGYVARTVYSRAKRGRTTQYLHRFLMNAPVGVEVDHINGHRLDNRHINLRLCTKAQNRRNTKMQCNSFSGYKGVHWGARQKKWYATIWLNNRSVHLGVFADRLKAAIAYNEAARKYFREFARLNRIP